MDKYIKLRKFISETMRKYLTETLKYKLEDNYIYYFINEDKIGYIEYYYDGLNHSENLENEKEFYISMIEVYKSFRANDYSKEMLNHIKDFAKQKGATIITLRVDYGMGDISKREPGFGLEKLYLRNGFKYLYTKEECELDDTKNLGAMYFKI